MNRSTVMSNFLFEEVARTQTSERVGDAQSRRRGRQVVMARRLSRRADRAAWQASVIAARSL